MELVLEFFTTVIDRRGIRRHGWRLAGFAGDRLHEYGFQSEVALDACFKEEVAAGTLVYSGCIRFYVSKAA